MSDQKEPDQGQQNINIELNEEVAEGIYSNLAIISHSNSEFVIDYVRLVPGVQKARVKSRIILTPQHAKRLYRALGENLQKFEAQHGDIRDEEGNQGMPLNFGPIGQA